MPNGDRQEAEYNEVCPGKGSTSYPRNLGAVPKLPQYYNLMWREGSSKCKDQAHKERLLKQKEEMSATVEQEQNKRRKDILKDEIEDWEKTVQEKCTDEDRTFSLQGQKSVNGLEHAETVGIQGEQQQEKQMLQNLM